MRIVRTKKRSNNGPIVSVVFTFHMCVRFFVVCAKDGEWRKRKSCGGCSFPSFNWTHKVTRTPVLSPFSFFHPTPPVLFHSCLHVGRWTEAEAEEKKKRYWVARLSFCFLCLDDRPVENLFLLDQSGFFIRVLFGLMRPWCKVWSKYRYPRTYSHLSFTPPNLILWKEGEKEIEGCRHHFLPKNQFSFQTVLQRLIFFNPPLSVSFPREWPA